jgi:hypothetical protein
MNHLALALRWAYPDAWAAGHLEWMRGVSMVTGLVGAVELAARARQRWAVVAEHVHTYGMIRSEILQRQFQVRGLWGRPDYLAGLLVMSMGVDLAAWLICRAWGQWGPQPVFQCIVLLAMCAVSMWPRRR